MMERKTWTLQIRESSGMTVAQYLKQELHMTKAQIRTLKFRENGIMINEVRVRVNQVLKTGDVLRLALSDDGDRSAQLVPSEEPLEILYEDEDVICVDKPAGLVVHPSHGHYRDSLSNQLRAYYLKKRKDAQIRSIGRLDKDTCGIVVFARHQVAAARLWQQKEQGIFQKEYLAWCEGIFPDQAGEREQTVSAPMARMPGELMKMCVQTGSGEGMRAVTHYQVVRQEKDRALVRLHPETGRTHQIRVHMAYLGHPLVGDPLYGAGKEGETHALLCAWKAEFLQPLTGEKVTVRSGYAQEPPFFLPSRKRNSP